MGIKNFYNFRGKDVYPILEEDSEKYIVCAIAKNEERYICEWIEHYFNLGFDKIIIGDNNDIGNNALMEAIKDIERRDDVVVIDIRGEKSFQNEFYSMFSEVGNYKWCAYFDIDEFLYLNAYNNVKDFLSKHENENYVSFNWVMYGPNGQSSIMDGSLKERFKYPLPIFSIENGTVKSIINGKYKGRHTIHSLNNDIFEREVNYYDGYIKHYKYKSLTEQAIARTATNATTFTDGPRNFELVYENNEYHNILISQINNIILPWRADGLHIYEGTDVIIYNIVKPTKPYVLYNIILRTMYFHRNILHYIKTTDIPSRFFIAHLLEYALHTSNMVCFETPQIGKYKYTLHNIEIK